MKSRRVLSTCTFHCLGFCVFFCAVAPVESEWHGYRHTDGNLDNYERSRGGWSRSLILGGPVTLPELILVMEEWDTTLPFFCFKILFHVIDSLVLPLSLLCCSFLHDLLSCRSKMDAYASKPIRKTPTPPPNQTKPNQTIRKQKKGIIYLNLTT